MVKYYVEIATAQREIRRQMNIIMEEIKMESQTKILFKHTEFDNESIESAWAEKLENGYRLDNILFYAKNYSLCDIVSVEEIEGELFVTGLVKENGHSTIRVLLKDAIEVPKVRDELKGIGCSSELSNMNNLISVDIPPEVSYSTIRDYLNKGEVEEKWEYQEACIASNHHDG